MLFAFFCQVDIAQMMQKALIGSLLVTQQKSSPWHQTVLVTIVPFTAMQCTCIKTNIQSVFHSSMS